MCLLVLLVPWGLGCRSTTKADCMDATRLQPPLPERKDHVEGQEGDTNGAPIGDFNAAQEAGEFVQFDEEVSMRIVRPYIKSTELLDGFKIIASDSQMDGKATIIPPGKLYKSSYAAPTREGRALL